MARGAKWAFAATSDARAQPDGAHLITRVLRSDAARVADVAGDAAPESQRNAQLEPPPAEPAAEDPALLRRALGHLRRQHEQLAAAEEELRAQVEELARIASELDLERQRYAALFHGAPEPSLVTDRNGVIRDANEAVSALLAVRASFLRGKPLALFVAHDDLRAVRSMLSGGPSEDVLPVEIRPRTGPPRRAVARVSPTSRADRLLWVLRADDGADADARARVTERALREIDDLLERERRRREELEQGALAKDRFVAVISHDLRGPLNAMLGWTQLLRRETLDQPSRDRALETIERNATTQARLLEELLDIARLAAGRVQLSLTAVDVGAVVGRVVTRLRDAAADKRVTLRSEVPAGGLVVLGDVQRVDQLLAILVERVIDDASPEGVVDVSARGEDGVTVLTVRGGGRGLSPDRLKRVFEIDPVDYAPSGAAVAMYIARRLVELHDGTIAATSELDGNGAVFTIRFPQEGGSS